MAKLVKLYNSSKILKSKSNKRSIKEDDLKVRVIRGVSTDRMNKVQVFINKNLLRVDLSNNMKVE